MAKQTFTTGQVLTAAQMTNLQQTALGGGSATAKVASYVLVAADAGTVVIMNSGSATTITVNTGLFAAGDTVVIQNIGAGATTITAGTATVNASASLALAQYEAGTLYFTSTSASIFRGSNPGDITGVTAGTGISGGGTSGDVTVTNSMATAITTAGDLIKGTGSGTFNRLGVGSASQVLTVVSGAPAWATPASGGGMTLLSTTTLTSTSTTIAIGTGFRDIQVRLKNFQGSSGGQWLIRFNSDSGSNYGEVGMQRQNATVSTQGATDTSWRSMGTVSANTNIEQVLCIYDYLNTTRRIGFINTFYTVSAGDDNETRTISYNGSAAISSVTISLAGTISGTALVIGVN